MGRPVPPTSLQAPAPLRDNDHDAAGYYHPACDDNRGPDIDHRGHYINNGSGRNDHRSRDDDHRGCAIDDGRALHFPAAFDSARHNRPAVPALPTSHDDDVGANGHHPSANLLHHQRAYNDHDGRSFEHCGPDDDKGHHHDLDH